MEKVFRTFKIKYPKGFVFDVFENIIKDEIRLSGKFDCSRNNISKKILAVHDVKENEVLSLLIGPYREYRKTSLEKFCQRISRMIYEGGWKEETIDILFAILLKEMKNRFSETKSGYIFTGVEGVREEGIIKVKDA